MEEVAPVSAPMLAMVTRWETSSPAAPGPVYSNTLPRPPLTPTRRSISSTTSLAEQPGRSAPVRCTLTTRGITRGMGRPVMAVATSIPPTPMQSIPMAPPWGVWLSPPISSLPGAPNRAIWTAWQTPFPGRERYAP